MRIELSVPDYLTVSRRLGKLNVSWQIIEGQGARHVVVDRRVSLMPSLAILVLVAPSTIKQRSFY